MRLASILTISVLSASAVAQTWLPTSFYPPWENNGPTKTIVFERRASESNAENGDRLRTAIYRLNAGEGLAIPAGTYHIERKLDVQLNGTAAKPIWIFGQDPNNRPIISRSDRRQNCLNVGEQTSSSYIAFRHLEITGGSDLVRLMSCSNIWIDQCWIHDGGGAFGISANARNTDHLYITRNRVWRPTPAGNSGEAMYLGANNNVVRTSYSIVALNHVYETASGEQGDGIELKQGSHHNWIVGNLVHDTNYPCILVYGTNGNGENVVENNIMYNSNDNVLQVQGEAIVRNNIAINGRVAGFRSFDHQGQVKNLRFVHNTIITSNRGADLTHWSGRPGMVFANNVVYSKTEALRFSGGNAGITLSGNVLLGNTVNVPGGFIKGTGITDFVNASWDATRRDVAPRVGGPLDNRGQIAFGEARDLFGRLRNHPVDPGAVESSASLVASTFVVNSQTGGTQALAIAASAEHRNKLYITLGCLTGTTPGLQIGGYNVPVNLDGWATFTLSNQNTGFLQNTAGLLDGNGNGRAAIVLPQLPRALVGATFNHTVTIWDGSANLSFVTNRVPLIVY